MELLGVDVVTGWDTTVAQEYIDNSVVPIQRSDSQVCHGTKETL